jgi:hypothetical protein
MKQHPTINSLRLNLNSVGRGGSSGDDESSSSSSESIVEDDEKSGRKTERCRRTEKKGRTVRQNSNRKRPLLIRAKSSEDLQEHYKEVLTKVSEASNEKTKKPVIKKLNLKFIEDIRIAEEAKSKLVDNRNTEEAQREAKAKLVDNRNTEEVQSNVIHEPEPAETIQKPKEERRSSVILSILKAKKEEFEERGAPPLSPRRTALISPRKFGYTVTVTEPEEPQHNSRVNYCKTILKKDSGPIEIPKLDDNLLQRTTIDKVKTKILARINVVLEILEKEQDYLRNMCMLILTFKNPMTDLQNKIGITEEQIQIAFGNLEQIIFIHQSLLQKLLARFENWNDKQTIGDIYLHWLEQVSLPYKTYAINYHDCLLVWEDIKDKPGVKNFLENTYANIKTSAGQLDVGAFLIKPIQRITRDYNMLFERLLHYTYEEHSDYNYIKRLIGNLKEITIEINSATRDPSDLKYFAHQEEVYSPRSVGGYIYKKGANVRNWKYRFMKLEIDTKELVYYKTDNRKEKKGSIPLYLITGVKPAIYRDKSGTERKNLFIIVTQDRTFFIQPHNQEQRVRWIDAIEYYREHHENIPISPR